MEKTCFNCGTPITKEYCEGWPEVCEHWTQKKPQTNADRIRAMSDEGIAKHFAAMFVEQRVLDAAESGKDLSYVSRRVLEAAFYSMLLRHLKQPVKDGEDDG